jgi:peptidyl-prolyl cis-trans isomerase SurA
MTTRAAAAAVLLAGGALGLAVQTRAELLEEIVAKVNDDIITKSEIEREEQLMVADLYRRFTGAELDREVKNAKARLLQEMIDRKLLIHRATRLYDVDKMKKALLESFMEQQKIKDPKELERLLAQEGMSLEDLERRLVEMAAPGEVIRFEVADRLAVGDAELGAYYEAHLDEFRVPAEATLREIVLLAGPEAREARRGEAERVRERAAAEGADFEAVAKEVSEAASAAQGGLIGPFRRGDLARPLEEAAFGLPAGSVSPVLESENGLHILKVESRTEDRVRGLDEVRDGLRVRLEDEKYKKALGEFLKKARGEANIWVDPKYRARYVLEIPAT